MSTSESTNTYGDDIDLVEVDASTIKSLIISQLESGVSEPLYPGDERRIFGEAMSPILIQLYTKMNDAARQVMLRYARGTVLDAIGARLGVSRLEAEKATTTLRFSVTTPQATNIVIPKWTKVTSDGEIYFATDAAAVLQAGAYSVDVPASGTEGGSQFNGYQAGVLVTLTDQIPYIGSVTNLTTTSGGTDGEPYTTTGDSNYRERIILAPSKLSTAGPAGAYEYWAQAADPSITDVKVSSDVETVETTLSVVSGSAYMGGDHLLADTLKVYAPGSASAAAPETDYTASYTDGLLSIGIVSGGALSSETSIDVKIDRTMENRVTAYVLTGAGELPSDEILEKVLESINASDVRPMTDLVKAKAPGVKSYDIELCYYTTAANESSVIENVEGSGGAIEQYNEWQQSALGRDINPDQLRRLILSPDWDDDLVGAVRVTVTSPQFEEVDDVTVAKFSGTLVVTHKVVEDV
nr:MAG TPA: baseplate assembly protein [Caudoviricetes sp.]